MKIIPLGEKIQIKVAEPTAGGLDLSSKKTATEVGEIVAVGEGVGYGLKVGDKILFKAWMADVINYEGENYYFLDSFGEGLCAIIKE